MRTCTNACAGLGCLWRLSSDSARVVKMPCALVCKAERHPCVKKGTSDRCLICGVMMCLRARSHDALFSLKLPVLPGVGCVQQCLATVLELVLSEECDMVSSAGKGFLWLHYGLRLQYSNPTLRVGLPYRSYSETVGFFRCLENVPPGNVLRREGS